MRLADLMPDVGLDAALADRTIAGISADSRAVAQDFVFFAVPGNKADGLAYRAACDRARRLHDRCRTRSRTSTCWRGCH